MAPPSIAVRAYAAERWARAVSGVVDSDADPRTLSAWARVIGASGGALRSWCRAAHVPAKSSLDFARLLRAVLKSQDVAWDPQNILDIVDERTLRHLFARAGLSGALTAAKPPTLQAFFTGQRLARDPTALRALMNLLECRLVDSSRVVTKMARPEPRRAD